MHLFDNLRRVFLGNFRRPSPRRAAIRRNGVSNHALEQLEERRLLSATVTDVFVISGGDSQVYQQRVNADGTPSGGPFLAASGAVKNIVVGNDGTGNTLLFAQGLDDQVYRLTFTGSTPSPQGYTLPQGGAVKSMTMATYGTTTASPVLFVIGTDNQAYFKLYGAGGVEIDQYRVVPGGVQAIDVSSTRTAAFVPTLFAIGLDGQVYRQQFTAAGGLQGTYTLTQPGAVQSIDTSRDAFGNLLLFGVGLDRQLYSQKFSQVGSNSWSLVTPGAIKSVEVNNDPTTNRPEVFAIATDDQVYALPLDNAGNAAASTYTLTRPGAVRSLVTGHPASNIVFILVIGGDSQVYAQPFDATGASIGPYFLASTGAVTLIAVPSTD